MSRVTKELNGCLNICSSSSYFDNNSLLMIFLFWTKNMHAILQNGELYLNRYVFIPVISES